MARPRMRPYPQNGPITIAANKTMVFSVPGTFVNVKQSNAPFTIRVDDTEEWAASGNRRFTLSDGDAFNKIEVVNDSGGNLTFQLEIGYGKIESDDVTITGTVNTDDANTRTSVNQMSVALQGRVMDVNTAVSDLSDLLKDRNLLRAPLMDLTNASYEMASGTTNNVVTSGANVNGAIIRICSAFGGSAECALIVNGNNVFRIVTGTAGNITHTVENILVPPGKSISLYSGGAGASIFMWYEVL